MATALKLKRDINKLKAAIRSKATPQSYVPKLKAQLQKAEADYDSVKAGKKSTPKASKQVKSSLDKLKAIVKKKKYGAYRAQGVDLKKDAERPALPTGKRISKSGNTYYEYRANRIDVKQPPKRYPKLEDGGMMEKGGRVMPFLKFEYATEARKKLDKGQLPVFDNGIGFDYLEKEKKLYYLPSVTGDWEEVGDFQSKKESIDWLSAQLKMEGFADGGEMAKGYITSGNGRMTADDVKRIKNILDKNSVKYLGVKKQGKFLNLVIENSELNKSSLRKSISEIEEIYFLQSGNPEFNGLKEVEQKGVYTYSFMQDSNFDGGGEMSTDTDFKKGDMVYIISYNPSKPNFFAEIIEVGSKVSKVEKENGTIVKVTNDQIQKSEYASGGYMAKGGEVKVGDVLTATTGVKVKVVEYDPKFGGRVRVERIDEYATGKPSQFMPLKKFKYGFGGEMAKRGKLLDNFSDKIQEGDIVWDSGNKRYGTVLNTYDFKYGEIRLDSDGNQPEENLHKLGSEGDKGTKDKLIEALIAHKRLIVEYPDRYEKVNYEGGGMTPADLQKQIWNLTARIAKLGDIESTAASDEIQMLMKQRKRLQSMALSIGDITMAKGGELHRSQEEKFKYGGYMAEGGKSQGYDDREDERLGMKYGKIKDKDFDGSHNKMEHSRRDDARFEERMEDGRYMAGGGIIELKSVGTYFRPSDLATASDEKFDKYETVYLSDVDNYEWWHKLSKEDRAKIEEHFDVDKHLMDVFDTTDLDSYDREMKKA